MHRRYDIVKEILVAFEGLYESFIETKKMDEALSICKKRSAVLGKMVRVIRRNQTVEAKAVDLSEDGELIVEHANGEKEKILSGEVSVRGLNGYI